MLGFKDFNNKLLIKLISSLNNQITLGYNFKKVSVFIFTIFLYRYKSLHLFSKHENQVI